MKRIAIVGFLVLLASCGQPQASDTQGVAGSAANQSQSNNSQSAGAESYTLVAMTAGDCPHCVVLAKELQDAGALASNQHPLELAPAYSSIKIEECYVPKLGEPGCDSVKNVCVMSTSKELVTQETKICAEKLVKYAKMVNPNINANELGFPFFMLYSPTSKKIKADTLTLAKTNDAHGIALEFKSQLAEIVKAKGSKTNAPSTVMPDAKVDVKPATTIKQPEAKSETNPPVANENNQQTAENNEGEGGASGSTSGGGSGDAFASIIAGILKIFVK